MRLQELFDANTPLMIAYMLREDLKALWSHRDPDEARGFWEDWYQRAMESGVAAIQRFAERIKAFVPGILAPAELPVQTSLIEGINNKIKVIKRMAYGFRDDEYFFLKLRAAYPGNARSTIFCDVDGGAMKFCIVGGFPRAGTRQFTDFLNKHDAITLKGEVYPQSLKQLADFVSNVDHFHMGKWAEERYREFRARTILNAIAGISKGTNTPCDFSSSNIFGFKTPYVELWKSSLDVLFSPETEEKINFFYCVRNVQDNFLSQNAFLGVELNKFIHRTVRSLNACTEVLNDDRYAFHILDLDNFIGTTKQSQWVVSNLYGKLNVRVPNPNKMDQIIENTGNRNATKLARGDRRNELRKDEREILKNHGALKRAIGRFAEISGHAVPFEGNDLR